MSYELPTNFKELESFLKRKPKEYYDELKKKGDEYINGYGLKENNLKKYPLDVGEEETDYVFSKLYDNLIGIGTVLTNPYEDEFGWETVLNKVNIILDYILEDTEKTILGEGRYGPSASRQDAKKFIDKFYLRAKKLSNAYELRKLEEKQIKQFDNDFKYLENNLDNK